MTKATFTSIATDALRGALLPHVEQGAVPGLAALLARGDDVHVETLGRLALGDAAPVARDALFRISSMTKPITAAATLMLVDEGRLQLGDAVDVLLPELAHRTVLRRLDGPLEDVVPASQPITVRDLLTFRMGFGIVLAPPDTHPIQRAESERKLGQGMPAPALPPAPDEWMRRLGELPLMHQPGERWMYNTGSDVLGVLIARASGQSFPAFLQERLFGPLGMRDTGFSVAGEDLHRLTTCYLPSADGRLDAYDDAKTGQWSVPPAFPGGAAGLVSTVDDYLSFARMLLAGGTHRGVRILSPASVALMTADQLTDPQRESGRPILGEAQGWGCGVGVHADGRYGWDGGLGTSWKNDPATGLVGILMTQVAFTSPAPPAVCNDFWRAARTIA